MKNYDFHEFQLPPSLNQGTYGGNIDSSYITNSGTHNTLDYSTSIWLREDANKLLQAITIKTICTSVIVSSVVGRNSS